MNFPGGKYEEIRGKARETPDEHGKEKGSAVSLMETHARDVCNMNGAKAGRYDD